nr:hypothetical protein [uncultured bacterium]
MQAYWFWRIAGAAGIVALVILPGCLSGGGSEYYTLDMRRSPDARPANNISVGAIALNEPLSQKNILIQKSPTQVEYYSVGQWSGGLDEMVREKLETEFGTRDPKARTLVLSGNLTAFEQVDVTSGAEAHVKLDAELREAGKSRYAPPLLRKTYDLRVPCKASGANEAAVALSRAVEQLAAQIAADAATL